MKALKHFVGRVPHRIQVDNGAEFISKALDKWAYENKVVLDFSRPGKPTDNAYIESLKHLKMAVSKSPLSYRVLLLNSKIHTHCLHFQIIRLYITIFVSHDVLACQITRRVITNESRNHRSWSSGTDLRLPAD